MSEKESIAGSSFHGENHSDPEEEVNVTIVEEGFRTEESKHGEFRIDTEGTVAERVAESFRKDIDLMKDRIVSEYICSEMSL